MENGSAVEPETQGGPEQEQQQPQPQGQFIGGEIRIVADARTGSINVQAPANLLVAFGMLEAAKVVLVQQQQEAMARAAAPAIKRASLADIPRIVRPS